MALQWKDIKGYEGLYKISNTGLVKSMPKFRNGEFENKEIILSSTKSTRYKMVTLYKNKKKNSFSIHRLVAMNFLKKSHKYLQVNHKDGNKLNNNVKNLEWVTAQKNIRHGFSMGLIKTPMGEKHPFAKISNFEVKKIRNLYKFTKLTQEKIGNMFGIGQDEISRIINFKRFYSVI